MICLQRATIATDSDKTWLLHEASKNNMRSSSGAHYIALDHVRALAAFMVFAWHFTHAVDGYPVPFDYTPTLFPLALLDEGHTGVALFMTLSGYLFAKLLDGKTIHYGAFIWNRFLRLVPLLAVVVVAVGIIKFLAGANLRAYLEAIMRGVIFPSLPNGGWSITVEFHYYLILPLFLWLLRRSRWLPLSLIAAAMVVRGLIYQEKGDIQTLAYWTIVGRIDQFALGMLVFQFRASFAGRHGVALATLLGFTGFYWYFDALGGFYQHAPDAAHSALWIFLPTLEGVAYAVGIAWYESSFTPSMSGVSRFVGRLGEYSYSIYLLHFFVVFQASLFVHEHVLDLSNFYLACLVALLFYIAMMPIGYLSFRYIEAPFLRLRKRYIVDPQSGQAVLAQAKT